MTSFESYRLNYSPSLPSILKSITQCQAIPSTSIQVQKEIAELFPQLNQAPFIRFETTAHPLNLKPLRVGVLFSGGQAAGGHNVITGLYDALKTLHADSALVGFTGGPGGLICGHSQELTASLLSKYRNLGGFDLLGSDRTKLEPSTQAKVLEQVRRLKLDGLVIVGGDDSNTNAAFLAEYFLAHGCATKVIGVPKTIDGDLKSENVGISFGFDTAAKTYSTLIGNLARDALSAKKYYYFVKLMGRTASHLALECALQTQINYTLIGEEIAASKASLKDVIDSIADCICERSKHSKNYGVILIPEGVLEFIEDCRHLMEELVALGEDVNYERVVEELSPKSKQCFLLFPKSIQLQLLLDRDPHGNLQVSKIETERLLIELVTEELEKRKVAKNYDGKFNPQPLFFGYEGRSCTPSNFDANYCYALGYVAAGLIYNGLTGYMSALEQLAHPAEKWLPIGVPLLSLMGFETRKGAKKAVIKKTLVNLEGKPFAIFKENRARWAKEDEYRYPGPIQYFGPQELTEQVTYTLAL
ncbi:MAG: diphosphate--fructose-6-phosphate 1-phosphotransferase [Parachlamydiaceae bacterium]